MNNFLNTIKNSAAFFAKEEEGAQVIEYALIIAVISIALILSMEAVKGNFGAWVTKVGACLTTFTCV